jgi:hypothetical protein
MGREPSTFADLWMRLRYRAAHPVQTLALLLGLGCVCIAVGAAAPAHSAPLELRHNPDQVCGQLQKR